MILDVSPDFKEQAEKLVPILRGIPERSRDLPYITAIALSHAHIGHYAGLIFLGKESANVRHVPCHCTSSMANFLRENAPWKALVKNENIILREILFEKKKESPETIFSEPVQIWDGFDVQYIRVPHRQDFTDTVGFSLNFSAKNSSENFFANKSLPTSELPQKRSLLFIPDIDRWEELQNCEEILASHKICLLDGTFFSKKEFGTIPRDFSTIPHPMVEDSINRFKHLVKNTEIYFTHLNHSNPISDKTSEEAKIVHEQGFKIASEMMQLKF